MIDPVNWILLGFKNSGKTYWGQKLASQKKRPFIDTDTLLHPTQSPRELYLALGEKGFRQREKEVILSLQGRQNSLIALGGGSILDPESGSFLKTLGIMIYLKASFSLIEKRTLVLPPFDLFEEFQRRAPLYEALSDIIIDMNTTDEKIQAAFNGL